MSQSYTVSNNSDVSYHYGWANPTWPPNQNEPYHSDSSGTVWTKDMIVTASGRDVSSPLEDLWGMCFVCGLEDEDVRVVCEMCRDVVLAMRKHIMKQMIEEMEGELDDELVDSGSV